MFEPSLAAPSLSLSRRRSLSSLGLDFFIYALEMVAGKVVRVCVICGMTSWTQCLPACPWRGQGPPVSGVGSSQPQARRLHGPSSSSGSILGGQGSTVGSGIYVLCSGLGPPILPSSGPTKTSWLSPLQNLSCSCGDGGLLTCCCLLRKVVWVILLSLLNTPTCMMRAPTHGCIIRSWVLLALSLSWVAMLAF